MPRLRIFIVLVLSLVASCIACNATLPDTQATKSTKSRKSIEQLFNEALSAAALLEPGLIEAVWVIPTSNPTVSTAQMGFASGRPHVVYVPRVMESIQRRYGDAAVVAIFGHELHHVIDVVRGFKFEDPHDSELSADIGAGCTVAVLGYSVEPFQNWLEQNTEESKTHPAPDERIVAAFRGTQLCAAPWN